MDTLVLGIGKGREKPANGGKQTHSIKGRVAETFSTGILSITKLKDVLYKEAIKIMRTISSVKSKTAYNIAVIAVHINRASKSIERANQLTQRFVLELFCRNISLTDSRKQRTARMTFHTSSLNRIASSINSRSQRGTLGELEDLYYATCAKQKGAMIL